MKPILFSTPMVQALLNTKSGIWPAEPIDPSEPYKTMTRRVIKPQPKHCNGYPLCNGLEIYGISQYSKTGSWYCPVCGNDYHNIKAYYEPGDILWVRETWCKLDKGHVIEGWYVYKATTDSNGEAVRQEYIKLGYPYQWRSSLFMPRKATRIFLEVKAVRVEHLQSINVNEALAEGSFLDRCVCLPRRNDKTPMEKLFKQHSCHIHGDEFKYLWDNLNAKRGYSWKSNPWVWVIEFMRAEKPKEDVW